MSVHRTERGNSAAVYAAAAAALFALAADLAGCNLQRAPAPAGAAPQLAADMGFYFNQDGQTASLAYGVAESDVLDLAFQCQRGTRMVDITDVAHPGAREGQVLTVISGGARSDLPSRVQVDEERAAPLATSRAPSDSPVMTAFRTSGRIDVQLGKQRRSYAATPAEGVSIGRFFAACERRP